ncbi:MAG: ATP-dependent RNA helicase, partial [Treponemataceae bacterium]|nr:ATP-dependent RNA helicase [Treponemataceae bacterium]
TTTYPVALVYDPPEIPASTLTEAANDAMLLKIESAVERVIENGEEGGILIFLPGEKSIHDCVAKLSQSRHSHRLFIVPLYGRLPKEEQENVFLDAPRGKIKVIVSTNIAETSVTIDGITTVIDSGLAKLNFYNPSTFTSSLVETSVSKASCMQRRGRAGRTGPGTCYRLYPKADFERREEYTTEEIFRTDLSEVILRMAELGIRDFEKFDFISKPSLEGIEGGEETLFMLKALNPDRTLSSIGKMMALFPLLPRISRIIVEAILKYPNVLEEALIAAAFLSTHSPFVLPPGSEMEARKAHHKFNDERGDFASYAKLYRTYEKFGDEKQRQKFAEKNYLDYKVLAEIKNIVAQLSEIVSDQGIPISGGGSTDDYLCCVASGMIQFVCAREGNANGGRRERGGNYRTLTADHIAIHPGSSLFRTSPQYIVTGEIVKTSRMFAMSVSPLTKNLLRKIDPNLEEQLERAMRSRSKKRESEFDSRESRFAEKNPHGEKQKKSHEEEFVLGGVPFKISKVKGKRTVELPYRDFLAAGKKIELPEIEKKCAGFRARVLMDSG